MNHKLPGGAADRLALFCEWTGATPPDTIITDEGEGVIFAAEFLRFAHKTGLSLDWFWMGDEKSLVMQAHNAARAA